MVPGSRRLSIKRLDGRADVQTLASMADGRWRDEQKIRKQTNLPPSGRQAHHLAQRRNPLIAVKTAVKVTTNGKSEENKTN